MSDEKYLDQLKHRRHAAPDYLAARIIANAAELARRDPWSELLYWFATRRLRGAPRRRGRRRGQFRSRCCGHRRGRL